MYCIFSAYVYSLKIVLKVFGSIIATFVSKKALRLKRFFILSYYATHAGIRDLYVFLRPFFIRLFSPISEFFTAVTRHSSLLSYYVSQLSSYIPLIGQLHLIERLSDGIITQSATLLVRGQDLSSPFF